MSRVCPQCSQSNPDSLLFCTRCGYRFPADEQEQATVVGIAPTADPAATLTPASQQIQVQTDQVPATPMPAYTPGVSASDPNLAQGSVATPVQQSGSYQQYQQMPPTYGQPPYNTPVMAMPTSTGGTFQRAFAGKGTPIRHQSWLLSGTQAQPTVLRNTLIDTIQRQGVLGVGVVPERLREHGVVMEERDYVRVQYGTTSIFVYLAPMGQNLYISRISTVQQPYSRVRIGVTIGLFVLMLICWALYAAVPQDAPFGFTESVKAFFGYGFAGLLFLFLFLLIRSIVALIAEADFLAFLRPHTLNDFTLDALSAVEQITDKGIRETVKQAGMNPAEMVQGQSFPLRQPLYRL